MVLPPRWITRRVRTVRYAAKVTAIASGVVLCFGFAGLFAWLIVREVVTKEHWWEIIPIIAVPVLVGPGGAFAWLWVVLRRRAGSGTDTSGGEK